MKKNLIVSIAIFIKNIGDKNFLVWTQPRDEKGSLYGKKEFPGGKIELDETPEEACRREVWEEVGIRIPPDEKMILFKYQDYFVENKNICLFAFISRFDKLPEEKGEWLKISYAEKSRQLQGEIPPINHIILDDLAVYIKKQFDAGWAESIWQQ